jgi:phospholipase D3/4
MDFRALTQVKELGVLIQNCRTLVYDMNTIHEVYSALSGPKAWIPDEWWGQFNSLYNRTSPFRFVDSHSNVHTMFVTSSPPRFHPPVRSDDLTTLLNIIDRAERFVYISVMGYQPIMIFYGQRGSIYFADIDTALRRAIIERHVEVRMLISYWNHTSTEMLHYLQSLNVLNKATRWVRVEVRLMHIPYYTEEQKKIPFSRVNHNKYMVTENNAFIGTSNWSGDYFKYTCGASLVIGSHGCEMRKNVSNRDLRAQTEALFLRDWHSNYTMPLPRIF